MSHADAIAIEFVAQQIYLDMEQKRNGVRMGLRWPLLRKSTQKYYMKRARAKVSAWAYENDQAIEKQKGNLESLSRAELAR